MQQWLGVDRGGCAWPLARIRLVDWGAKQPRSTRLVGADNGLLNLSDGPGDGWSK
jgi:hypothetical protein